MEPGRQGMGEDMKTDFQIVSPHWQAIKKWLNTPPQTVRYLAPEDRRALADKITGAVTAARLELARLREAETAEQRLAREERQRHLDRRNEIAGIVATKPETPEELTVRLLSLEGFDWRSGEQKK